MIKRSILLPFAISFAFMSQLHAAPELPTAYFNCGKTIVQANYHNDVKLDLTIDNKHYQLISVISGSGAKYETPKGVKPYVLFWNKGREAIMKIGNMDFPSCHQTDAPIAKLLFQHKEWSVTKINDKDPIEVSQLIILFSDKGQISGFSGCNHFSGHYVLKDEDLTIKGPMASTKMACMDKGMMDQERHFMAILQKIKSAKILYGKDLLLLNESDESIKLIPKK